MAGPSWRYVPVTGRGFYVSLLLCLLLIISYIILQAVIGAVISQLLYGPTSGPQQLVEGMIIGTLPAALVTALIAWAIAGLGGANRRDVLALYWPPLNMGRLLAVVLGFLLIMMAVTALLFFLTGANPEDYAPKNDGSTEAGAVKEAMFSLAHEKGVYILALLGVAVGAPLVEEITFRGQLFATLSQSRLGGSGATVVTSAAWAMMHVTEPWLNVAMIFCMGLVLGALLLRYGSLILLMFCHGAWNAVFAIIMWFGASN